MTAHSIATAWWQREKSIVEERVDRRVAGAPQWLRDKILRSSLRAAMRRLARRAIAEAAERATAHLARDYRPGVGSGRTADWLDIGFRHYAITALLVHTECGYSGETVRQITRVLRALCGGWPERRAENLRLDALPPCPVSAVYWPSGGYPEEHCRRMVAAGGADEHIQRWRLWYRWHVERAIGEADARSLLARLAADPAARISGYLADSILSWRAGRSGYEGCSGSAYMGWFRDHPEHWDTLLARAPIGKSGDGWEQVFPHERERAAAARARGWHETMRLSDSIWTARHPLAAANHGGV